MIIIIFFLFLGLICILNFILRAYPTLFNKFYNTDNYIWLIEIQAKKGASNNFPGYKNYPPLFPKLYSILPLRFFEKTKKSVMISPIFFDLITNILISLFLLEISNNIVISLIGAFIYSVLPSSILSNNTFHPRSLAFLLYTLNYWNFYELVINMNLYCLIFLFILLPLLLLTHKMSIQVIYISFPILGLIFNQIMLTLLLLGISILIALIISKGEYYNILKKHVWSVIGRVLEGIQEEKYSLKKNLWIPFVWCPFIIIWIISLFFNFQIFHLDFFDVNLIILIALIFIWPFGQGYQHAKFMYMPICLGISNSSFILIVIFAVFSFIYIFFVYKRLKIVEPDDFEKFKKKYLIVE